MSVFGGDSWGREAQYRKRRVDDLIADGIDDRRSSSTSIYKKLSNGKYACLICPHSPTLDTPLMLSMHIKGSRHRAAEIGLKEKELVRENERNKRIALSECSTGRAKSSTHTQRCSSPSKPLIEQARKTASEILCNKSTKQHATNESNNVNFGTGHSLDGPSHPRISGACYAIAEAGKVNMQQQSDFQERRERELKFTAAGWKRDCHGMWFRDENVEFDSDEEDPNDCLG